MTAEEYIKDFTRGCSNELDDGEYEYWLTPWQAETACNLAREEVRKQFEKEQLKHHDETEIEYVHKDALIKKVCEFIKTNAEKHIYFDEGNSEWYDSEECIEDFKNYMKREMS